jgi:hypothetical protein
MYTDYADFHNIDSQLVLVVLLSITRCPCFLDIHSMVNKTLKYPICVSPAMCHTDYGNKQPHPYGTYNWQRVRVLSMNEQKRQIRVRFIDIGGTAIVDAHCLFRIYDWYVCLIINHNIKYSLPFSHASRAPFAIECQLTSIVTKHAGGNLSTPQRHELWQWTMNGRRGVLDCLTN